MKQKHGCQTKSKFSSRFIGVTNETLKLSVWNCVWRWEVKRVYLLTILNMTTMRNF